jgi:DNA-binding transcriptional MerR regulator
MAQEHTVSELAELTGVTVRALHHYDEIGLLTPTRRSDAGYRLYSEADVQRLGRIVALRSTGMGLADVGAALDGSSATREEVLRRRLLELDQQAASVARQRVLLVRTQEAQDMEVNMGPEDMLKVFGDHDPGAFEEEAAERWGTTDAYAESRRRTSSYTKDDWAASQADAEAAMSAFVQCKVDGLSPGSPEARAAAAMHRAAISRWYYPCSVEMQVGLAEMYLADPRFTTHYDEHLPGLAQYVHDAIMESALRD